MTIFRFRYLISLAALLLSGCNGDNGEPEPPDSSKDREVILVHWTDNIIIPSYTNFKAKFDVMLSKADAFTAAPGLDALAEFRTAWADAYAEWQKVELFEFGPAEKYTIRNFFNIYPADIAGIESNINDPSASMTVPLSYARQGFPALDYLLNGVAIDDDGIVAWYTGSNAASRLAYIDRVISRMNTLISDVISEWNGSYRATFITKTGLDIGSSFGLVVNAYVLHYERYIRTGKFGIPSGVLGGTGTPLPDKVEAVYARDISLTLSRNAHDAAIDFFNGVNVSTGAEGSSFKSYLDALEAKDKTTNTLLSDMINEQFTIVNQKLDLLSEDFYHEVQNNNQAMIDVYTEMQKAVRMLKVDMTSAMSVTITYTDNDGD